MSTPAPLTPTQQLVLEIVRQPGGRIWRSGLQDYAASLHTKPRPVNRNTINALLAAGVIVETTSASTRGYVAAEKAAAQ